MMITILISAVLACLIHEAGHYFTARFFGEWISFRFAWGWLWGKVPIPRFIWYMPAAFTARQKMITGLAGFGAEFLAAPIFIAAGLWPYAVIALAHFALYGFYAGEASDFKWLKRES